MDVPLRLPFYVNASSFSNVLRRLPQHVLIANTEPTPPTVYYYRQLASISAAIGTPEENKPNLSLTRTMIYCSDVTIGAIHYKAPIDHSKQIEQHTNVHEKV